MRILRVTSSVLGNMKSGTDHGRAEQDRLDRLEHHLHQWRRKPSWHQRFDRDAEQAYVRHRYLESLLLQRFSMGIAVFFYCTYLGFDALTFQRYTDLWIYLFVLGFCALPVLTQTAVTFVEQRQHVGPGLAPWTLVINGLGLTLAAAYCTSIGVSFPREVFTIHLLYVFFLLGTSFRIGAPIALFNSALYVAGQAVAQLPFVYLAELAYVQIGSVVLLGATSWLAESTHRRAWVQAQMLLALSERDGLTNLFNHRAFFERCEPLLKQAHRDNCRIALAVVDLDHFKDYNDHLGHMKGDTCLREVSGVLADAARRPLDMAARLGGEEFVLFWYDVSPQWAMDAAENVRRRIEELQISHPASSHGRVTASIGVSCVLPSAQPVAIRLVNAADAALYEAKDAGRNTVRAAWDKLSAVPSRQPEDRHRS